MSARGPSARGAIRAIALNTFREAVRDRILYLILVFALALILGARFVSMLTVGDEAKIIKDLGLSSISVFGVLTAMFVGVSLVFKEIEKRTIYTLLAHPVRRWHFVVGKYLGLVAVLVAIVVLTGSTLVGVLLAHGEAVVPLLPAIALILVELLVVAAFAILFSAYTNPILAALGTVAMYVAGHLVWSFELLKSRLPTGPARTVADALQWILPNLDKLDVKAEAVHGTTLAEGRLGAAMLYGVSYALVVVVAACVVFERREFR